MSAEIETVMYTREKPWHGIGTRVEEAPTSADALRLAGLDWEVHGKEINVDGQIVSGYKANVRSSDGAVLGIVSDRYTICQNKEAFAFTDALIGGDVRYETAGSLKGGHKIWLLAKMPERDVLGDKVDPYLCFVNTHDGSGPIRVCMTPIRVVCNNTLNLALRTASRSWSTRHIGSIEGRLHEAEVTLELGNRYMDRFAEFAERAANTSITNDQIMEILKEMFPLKDDMGDVAKKRVEKAREEFMVCTYAEDIKEFRGTAWGMLNAMSDMADHTEPVRKTKNYKESNFERIVMGHPLLDKMFDLLRVH